MEPFPYLEHISVYRNCSHLGAGLSQASSSHLELMLLNINVQVIQPETIHVKQVISELWQSRSQNKQTKHRSPGFQLFFFFKASRELKLSHIHIFKIPRIINFEIWWLFGSTDCGYTYKRPCNSISKKSWTSFP